MGYPEEIVEIAVAGSRGEGIIVYRAPVPREMNGASQGDEPEANTRHLNCSASYTASILSKLDHHHRIFMIL